MTGAQGKDDTKVSKFLSYVLRHRPDEVGLTLDEAGWVAVESLLQGCRKAGTDIDEKRLDRIVAEDGKQRYAFSSDRRYIRAQQGHSVEVDLGYEPAVPPEILYHGTVGRSLEAIMREGLKPMSRHHVHLSETRDTAVSVGQRRGRPVILEIRAGEMYRAGSRFYRTPNGVWLTAEVPPTGLVAPDPRPD